MAPPRIWLFWALLPLASALLDPSPTTINARNANNTSILPNCWMVVWKQDLDQNVLKARQATFAATLRKRSIGKRDANSEFVPMTSTDSIIGDLSITSCRTDAKTMSLMLEDAGDDVDFVDCCQEVNVSQPQKKKSDKEKAPEIDFEALKADQAERLGAVNGTGTMLYSVDTGCQPDHIAFSSGQVTLSKSLVKGGDSLDKNGHGTHTAATAAGLGVGVAPGANVTCVQALDAKGAGSSDSIIQAFSNICADVKARGLECKCVINASLGTQKSEAVNRAADNTAKCGCLLVAAAGNEDQDAGNTSPASAKNAMAVGATDVRNNEFAGFSNLGDKVAVSVNGVNVISADSKNLTGFKVESGTSMSCPQVAGRALIVASSGQINRAAACSEKIKGRVLAEAKQEKPVKEDPKALDTSPLQLQAEVPIDPNGSTAIGAGNKPGGASQGFNGATGNVNKSPS